jgi:hypothetical protein
MADALLGLAKSAATAPAPCGMHAPHDHPEVVAGRQAPPPLWLPARQRLRPHQLHVHNRPRGQAHQEPVQRAELVQAGRDGSMGEKALDVCGGDGQHNLAQSRYDQQAGWMTRGLEAG